MAIKISEKLNLVIPLYHGNQVYSYVYSTPISREIFELNHLLIAKTFTKIMAEGLGTISGPRVAAMLMRDVAKQMDAQQQLAGVDRDDYVPAGTALANEIKRLTNVLVPTDKTYEILPFEEALKKKLLDADDLSSVENALAFFTVSWAMLPRQTFESMIPGAIRLWGAELSSLSVMAYIDSLQTLTETDNSGEKRPTMEIVGTASETKAAPTITGSSVEVHGRDRVAGSLHLS